MKTAQYYRNLEDGKVQCLLCPHLCALSGWKAGKCGVRKVVNDDPAVFSEMTGWISSELGAYTVLHLSRYFPRHKLRLYPTPVKTLRELCALASKKLHYVYLGNVASPVKNLIL